MWPFERRPVSPPAPKRPPRPRQLHPVPMTEAQLSQLRVQSEVDQAHLQATNAHAELESISGDHLQVVLRLPRAERTKRIDDPELLAADRQTLIDSLAGDDVEVGGWRTALNSSRRDTLLRLWGHNRHRLPMMVRTLVVLGPTLTFVIVAYSNTGERVDNIPRSEIKFRTPEGRESVETIGGNQPIFLIKHFGQYSAREWKERRGYALAPVTVDGR